MSIDSRVAIALAKLTGSERQLLQSLIDIVWEQANPEYTTDRALDHVAHQRLARMPDPPTIEKLLSNRISRPIPCIGTRVRTLVPFAGLPIGTEGVVDEHYGIGPGPGGCMVAWDIPGRPLPPEYALGEGFEPAPPFSRGAPLRDGFSQDELEYLEIVEEP